MDEAVFPRSLAGLLDSIHHPKHRHVDGHQDQADGHRHPDGEHRFEGPHRHFGAAFDLFAQVVPNVHR